jgi:hypothetical protein
MREMYGLRLAQKLTKSEAIRQVQLGFVNSYSFLHNLRK